MAAAVTANFRRCVETGGRMEYDEELDLPAGRRYFHTTLIPIRDAERLNSPPHRNCVKFD